jgi:hypothetical protein
VLPADYSTSAAKAITISGSTIYVGGYAYNDTTMQSEAILWIGELSKPSVKVNGRKKVASASAKFTIKGTASDPDGDLARVEVKLGKGGYKPASGLEKWAFKARLKPGRNTLLVRAVDETGQMSAPVQLVVTRR